MPSDLVGTRIYRPDRGDVRRPSSARSSPTSCSPTRSTAPRPRSSPRCSRSCRSTRSRSATRPSRSRRRSSSWRPRTRSRPRAPTRCPRRRSTGSCSRSCSTTRAPPTRRRSSPARCARRPPPREILDADGPAAASRQSVDDVYVDPRLISYAVAPRRGHAQAHLLGRARPRVLRLVRRQPARLDQPHPRRPRDGAAPRPPLRPARPTSPSSRPTSCATASS